MPGGLADALTHREDLEQACLGRRSHAEVGVDGLDDRRLVLLEEPVQRRKVAFALFKVRVRIGSMGRALLFEALGKGEGRRLHGSDLLLSGLCFDRASAMIRRRDHGSASRVPHDRRAVGGRHVRRHRVGPVCLRQRTLHDLGDVCVGDLLDRWRDADARVQPSDRDDETRGDGPGVRRRLARARRRARAPPSVRRSRPA